MQDEPAFLSSAPRSLPLALEDRVCSCRVHALLAVVAPAKHESKFRSPCEELSLAWSCCSAFCSSTLRALAAACSAAVAIPGGARILKTALALVHFLQTIDKYKRSGVGASDLHVGSGDALDLQPQLCKPLLVALGQVTPRLQTCHTLLALKLHTHLAPARAPLMQQKTSARGTALGQCV